MWIQRHAERIQWCHIELLTRADAKSRGVRRSVGKSVLDGLVNAVESQAHFGHPHGAAGHETEDGA